MKQPFVYIIGGSFSNTDKDKLRDICTPHFYPNSQDVDKVLKKNPDVIITISNQCTDFEILMLSSFQIRRKWLHYKSSEEFITKMWSVCTCFVHHAIEFQNGQGLVSVFTTSFNSKHKILRPLTSLLKQSYTNWEWIIMDDSTDDNNWELLKKIKYGNAQGGSSGTDPRIRIYKSDKNSGVIGHVKNVASSLARGEFIFELDHDDDITPDALSKVVKAFEKYPDAGFAYSDFVELFEDGRNFNYGSYFALGFGAYRNEFYNGKWREVCCTPNMNSVSIRHIVAAPNHFRAWRKKQFWEMNGWNSRFHVADDYEFIIRTFLHTRMIRIPDLCYLQYRNDGGNNFTLIRNKEIQKLVNVLKTYYEPHIVKRLQDLKVEDIASLEDHSKFEHRKYWEVDYTVPTLNYTYTTTRISIVITIANNDPLVHVQSWVEQAVLQDQVDVVYVVGDLAVDVEQWLYSTSNPKVKWWKLEQSTGYCEQYARKMLTHGEKVVIWPKQDEIYSSDYAVQLVT